MKSPIRTTLPFRPLSGIALAAVLSVAAIPAAGAEYRLFDSFENAAATGTPMNGLASTSGRFAWAASGSSVALVKGDGTAFHGTGYAQIADRTGGQHTLTMTLSGANQAPFKWAPNNKPEDGGTRLSFVFRRKAVEGQEENMSGVNFSLYGHTTNETETVRSATFINGVNLFSSATELGRWYRFECELLTFRWNTTQVQPIPYGPKITDTVTGEIVWQPTANSYRQNFTHTDPEDVMMYSLKFMTWSSGQALIDVDDIRIGPDPSPSAGLIISVQ